MAKDKGFTSTLAIVAVVVVGIAAYANSLATDKPNAQAPKAAQSAVHIARIPAGVDEPWKPADYPATVQRLTLPVFRRAVSQFPKVARIIAREPGCDEVSYIGIRDMSTPAGVYLFADCNAGLRRDYTLQTVEDAKI